MRLLVTFAILALGALTVDAATAQTAIAPPSGDAAAATSALAAPRLGNPPAQLKPPILKSVAAGTTSVALPTSDKQPPKKKAAKGSSNNTADAGSGDKPLEVTADKSLEYYQDAHIYVARDHARAVRGDMVVDADLLTAHEREKPKATPEQPKPPKDPNAKKDDNGGGDIDTMTAEGHVRVTDTKSRTTGDKAVYDMDKHTMVMTGKNLKYETAKQVVTARDALEYYEDKKIAVARGKAVEDDAGRHVEGDVLTAEFANGTDGNSDLTQITADGHVKVVTKTDTVFGDNAVYDAARDVAVIRGNVRITRPDGMQLTGDVAEVDFKSNQSRLLNSGTGRVRALLPSRMTDKASGDKTASDKTAAKDTTR